MPFTCPNCGASDQIDIDATVRVRIVDQDTEGNFGTDADASEDGSHEWDATSGAYCAHCGYSGTVGDFEREDDGPQPDEEEEEGDDLCDTCMKSGVTISHTRDGQTVCLSCAKDDADARHDCSACNGKGYLLVDPDGFEEQRRIERCDACMTYQTDDAARTAAREEPTATT